MNETNDHHNQGGGYPRLIQASNPEILKPVSETPAYILGYLGAVPYFLCCYKLYQQAHLIGGTLLLIVGILFPRLARLAWRIGESFRRYAHPDYYTANGAVALAQVKLYWKYGPQIYSIIFMFIFTFLVTSYIAIYINIRQDEVKNIQHPTAIKTMDRGYENNTP